MSEDTDVAQLKFPRYYTNLPNSRKLPDRHLEGLANGGPGASGLGSNLHKMNKTKPNEGPRDDQTNAGNKLNMPHLSRSRSFRESFNSGGYSVFKDFDAGSIPMYEITPISAGDFQLSGDPNNQPPQKEDHKPTLTETIASFGFDAMPASGSSKRNNLSNVLNEFGFNPERNNGVPCTPAVDSWNADAQETSAALNSRQKQRARSEPAGPRKTLAISEDFSDNILKSLRSPGAGPEITTQDNSTPPLKLFNGSAMNDQPGHLTESDLTVRPIEKPNVYLHTLDRQMIEESDTGQRQKGKRKRGKPRNAECFIPILTANMENPNQKGSSPEKHNTFFGEDPKRSLTSPRGIKFNDKSVDKSTLQSPRRSSPKRESSGTSPRNQASPRNQPSPRNQASPRQQASPRNISSPKGKPQQDAGNTTSPPKKASPGGGKSSPSSPKVRREASDTKRSRSQDSPRGKLKSKSPPYKDRNCEFKISQPCNRRSRFCGQCYRPAFQGNIFKNLAQAVGCQLACIANCNQRYQGFPGIQGLFTPEVEVQSLFNQQPYTVCDGYDEPATTTPASRKEVRSAPRRHGTPAFYSNRRHSLESFRYRAAQGSEYRQRGVSQQAQQSRRFVSTSDRKYQSYGRDYPPLDDRQLRFELKQTSQSSVTSLGDNNIESSQSTEPPDEHSLAESRYSVSRSRDRPREKERYGSEIRMQRSGTESDKRSIGNVSPRSLVSEDDDQSAASRKSARSTERRSQHDVRQSRRPSEVSQRLDVISPGQVRFQPKKQVSSESDDRLQTDSGESITNSEKQFLDRTRQVLEESFKGPHVLSRKYPMSEKVSSNDVIRVCKSMQCEENEPTEQKPKDERDEEKRRVTTDEEWSASDRKPMPGRRTPVPEGRRAKRTQLRDRSQEYAMEVSRRPMGTEEWKEEKILATDERKDVYSVGDRMMDGGGGIFCDQRSEIPGSMNTNIQVYTTLYSHDNHPQKGEDDSQVWPLSGKQDSKDNERIPAKREDWSTERESDHSLLQSNNSRRSDLHGQQAMELGSNLHYDSATKGTYSDTSRSNTAGKPTSGKIPHGDTPYDQTTPEHSVSSRCSNDLSGSRNYGLSEDPRSQLEHRKSSQPTTCERKRTGRREKTGSSQEESQPDVSKFTERERKRTGTANDLERSHTHSNGDDSDEYRSRQNQQTTDLRSRHDDSEEEVMQRPAVITDSRESGREGSTAKRICSKPPSVPHTDCSSAELTMASGAEGRDASPRKRIRRSREVQEDELRAAQKVEDSPFTSKRQGYRERSELRPTDEEFPVREDFTKTLREQCMSQTIEYSCTEPPDNADSRRAAENQGRSTMESKHSSRHRRSKRDYDSAYDEDMDEGVSQEDASTSISRQLPVEGPLDNYYDQRGQEETKSLRERSSRRMHFGEIVERNCHSERLSARSSSFKYEAGKRMQEKYGSLQNHSSAEQKGKSTGVGVKSTSSRSSHTINSPEEEEAVHQREASIRDSLVTMRENKRVKSSREWRHRQRKLYSSADTRSTTGNDTHDEEDSENTLPASPGDLESEDLDDEAEDKTRSGKHAHHRAHRGMESDLAKMQQRPPGHHDSQDESHNSSSCRTTPLEAYCDKLRTLPSPIAKQKLVRADENVKKYIEFLASKSAMTVERESLHGEPFHSDSCMERRCLETRSSRNRHRTYCEGNSGFQQTDRSNTQTGHVSLRSHIRTKSPKFQYYRKKSPQKVEDDRDEDEEEEVDEGNDDDGSEDDMVVNKIRSRSNSARCGNRSRRCQEGRIDLFEQIIIPEQPLHVDEYRHMNSIKDGVPFFCESLRVRVDLPETRKSLSPESEVSKSVSLLSPIGELCPKETLAPEIYAWKRQLSRYTDSLEISSTKNASPVSSGRHSFTHLKSLLLQSGQDKIQIYSHRRAETQSATTTVRPAEKISRLAEFDVSKDSASVFSPECPNIEFQPALESSVRTRDTSKEDNDDDLVVSCDVVSWTGNKNFSSNADRDRNSSSGNGDNWYPEYAYRCGVIDTLRILDSDLAMSTPSAEFIHPCPRVENTSESCKRHHEIEDHLAYIMRSFPSLALCKQTDETFEIIRQNSLRALVYAAKLSVDWPAANFYDKNAGHLENWIQELKEYSSASDVSSLSDSYSFDGRIENEKLRIGQNVTKDKKKYHVSSKSLKYSVYPSSSPLPKVEFRGDRIDDESASSPDRLSQHDDAAENSASERTLDNSESLTEHQGETAERKGTGVENSETTTYLSDSDSHGNTEQGSNSEVIPGAENSGHELQQPAHDQHTTSYLYKKGKISDPNQEEGILTKFSEGSQNTNGTNAEPLRIRLRKAELSPTEETRLRTAISRKLGSQRTFALIPVAFSQSLMSTVQGVCDRSKQLLEKDSDATCGYVVTKGRPASDKDIHEIFEEICDTRLSSPQNTMAFYVVAVDKQGDADNDETRKGVQICGVKSREASCEPEDEGKHKKYYIYTKEELVKAVANSFWEKCDLVKPSELPQLHDLQQSADKVPSHLDRGSLVNSKQEMTDMQSNIQRIQQSMDTRSHEHAKESFEMKSNSKVELQAAERDFACPKDDNYIYNTSRGQCLETVQTKQKYGKCQFLDKQDRGESMSSTLRAPNSANASPGFSVNKHSSNEDSKKIIEVADDRSDDLINKYRLKSEIRSTRETREHGESDSVSRHFLPQKKETSFSGQSVEGRVQESEHGLEKRHRIHTNSYSRDLPNASKVLSQNRYGNLIHNDLPDRYQYSKRDEGVWSTKNDEIWAETVSANKNRLRKESRRYERREENCSNHLNNIVHENAATNKCSSSTITSTVIKTCRKSKSYSDLDVSKVHEEEDSGKQKKKRKISCQHKTLSLLETLVDGQLIEFFNNALKKITSPKHTICLRIAGDSGKSRKDISQPATNNSKKDCDSALSSEEDDDMTSPSVVSAIETMTEKSLTEESITILSLPAESRDKKKRRNISPATKKQQNDTLQEWINSLTPEITRMKSKSDKHKEKFVLSAKRKRLVYKGRGKYRCRLRAHREVQSSESGNITNSANDENESEASDMKYHTSPARSRSERRHRGGNRRMRKRTPDVDNNHSSGKRRGSGVTRSRPRRNSKKATTRSETRYRSSSRHLSVTRGKRIKNCSLDSRRKSGRQEKSRKRSSPAKSPNNRHDERLVKIYAGKVNAENKEVCKLPLMKNMKTFGSSGISRIAQALNLSHLKNARNDELCDEGRCCHPMQAKLEDKKRKDDTPEKYEARIPISDDDSMAGCEPFESCLLTPIKEESHSHDHTGSSDKSKSDFEAFVTRCRSKLLGISTDSPHWMHDHIEGCNRRKANSTMSCSNFSSQRSSTSSGNRGSEDTDSCESRRQCSRHRLREWCCSNHESDYECEAGDKFKRNAPRTREYSFSYFQYVVPYKSAFLRRQMHDLIKEEAPVYKKEDELLKMYATGSSRSEYVNNARGNLTIPWTVRQANASLNWRKPEESRFMSEADAPVYTRSAPGIRCPKTVAPSASVSQTRTLASLYSPYRPGNLFNNSSQMNDFADMPSQGVRSRFWVSGDQGRHFKHSSSNWLSSGNTDYQDLIHRNWNESANNGSDGSSSGDISGNEDVDIGEGEQRGEYLKRGQMKGKPQGGDAAAATSDRCGNDKVPKEPRVSHAKPNHYIKSSHNGSLEDSHCQCRDHGCMSYDFIHQNYSVARVPNFAARNINGSGNMFGRGLNPSDERLSAIQDHDADSEEEFNSATEELPHYSSSCRKRPKYGRKGQEIDDTCNHPESVGYYMGDGPSGQYDNFEELPKEDLLINLSPVNTDDDIMYRSRHQKNATCQRAPPSQPAGQASAAVNKPGRNDCEMHGPGGVGHQMDKNSALAGRSCYGQGDILNKRVFTQWYVDEGEKAQQSQRRPLVSVAQAEKCPHRERWITPSENCGSSFDDGEEDDDDDEDNDCEDEDDDGEENEEDDDDDGEVDEDDEDDEDDDEEEDDDENEEDDEEDDDDDENNRAPGQNKCEDERNPKEKPRCLDHMKEKNAQNNYHHEKPQDINESKIVGHRMPDTEQTTKRPTRIRTLAHTKRYTTGNKQGHQQSTGDHLAKPKQAAIHEKNMHVKPTGAHQHKFSLEQIKVPAIEKERVRFACDENGDWAEIGRGSYGCVYLGLLDGVVEVAIKDFYESSSWDLVIHEARMLMFLQDTGITPKFYGLRRRFDVSKQPSEYCIIMEYFGDGRTLFNVMSDKMVLAGDEWMDIVGQLVAGLRLIHRKNVLINDLKADNILIDLTGGRKIIRYIDVGMATYKQGLTFQLPQDQMSKYNFLAPEVREGARTTTRSDIYSLGYMLEQMCRMADSTLGGLRKLVARCMEKNPARRPDIDDIVSQVHRFIASKASILINSNSPREQFVLTNSV